MNTATKSKNKSMILKKTMETENEVLNQIEDEISTLKTILRQMFGY